MALTPPPLIKGKPGLDVNEELRFHLDQQRQANIAAGMSSGEARRQAMIAFGGRPGHRHAFSYPMYLALRDQSTVFSGLIASASATVGVVWNNRAETVPAERVSGNYFETLGIRPAHGRLLVAEDEIAEGSNPVAVLGFAARSDDGSANGVRGRRQASVSPPGGDCEEFPAGLAEDWSPARK